jgi:hypothetical protein
MFAWREVKLRDRGPGVKVPREDVAAFPGHPETASR